MLAAREQFPDHRRPGQFPGHEQPAGGLRVREQERVGLGLDTRAAAAAERAGLLRRLPGNVLLSSPDAPERAARILADLPQPFTAAKARRALGTSRRVVIPLLEWLDREGVTRRLPDDRRTMCEPPGSPGPNGGP